jgi:hypothetical protein
MEVVQTATTTRGRAGAGWQRRRLPGYVLALLAIVVASLAAAAPAMADPIDQILVNGSAPNSHGTGLQVSATFGSALLMVTNKSSSYTDIKEIDGVVLPATLPFSSATNVNDVSGASCSVSGSSFSCPGLSVAPGDSASILLHDGESYPYNGLASVNVIYDSIEVSGKPMDPNGKGLQVTAVTKKASCPDLSSPSNWCLTVTSSPGNGTNMTAVATAPNSSTADSAATQVAQAEAGFGFSFGFGSSFANGCGLQNGGFECPAPFGVSPQVYGFDFASSSFSSGLGDIQVSFQSTPCTNNVAQASSRPAIAEAAKANCTPPSHTKITVATINNNKHTAFFKFTAKGTKKFICELTRNAQRLYYAPCHSPKPYATKLKKGTYVFRVDAINQGGTDPHPAKKKFTLS